MTTYRYGIVGNGWRAGFFHRAARDLPSHLRVTGVVTTSAASAERASTEHRVPGFTTIDAMLDAERPDFVVVCVPRESTLSVVTQLTDARMPVLLETPPANDTDGLRRLWAAVGATGLVQVAEQYPRYPGHAARRAIIDRGVIGTPTAVQVSSTHEYHAVALIRSLLGVGFARAEVRSQEFASVLVDPLARDRWTEDSAEKTASTMLSTVDFGGAMGLYDFTTNQWHNQLLHRRIVIRGSRGEIVDNQVVHLRDPRTIIESPIVRRQLGYDLDLDGYATDHLSFEGETVWRNAFAGTRLSDEELSIAELVIATGAFSRGEGPDAYSLADASQDHAIALAMRSAAAHDGREIVDQEPWVR